MFSKYFLTPSDLSDVVRSHMTAAPNLHSSPRLPVDEALIRAEGLQLQPRGGRGRGHRARSRVSVIIMAHPSSLGLDHWEISSTEFALQILRAKLYAKWRHPSCVYDYDSQSCSLINPSPSCQRGSRLLPSCPPPPPPRARPATVKYTCQSCCHGNFVRLCEPSPLLTTFCLLYIIRLFVVYPLNIWYLLRKV